MAEREILGWKSVRQISGRLAVLLVPSLLLRSLRPRAIAHTYGDATHLGRRGEKQNNSEIRGKKDEEAIEGQSWRRDSVLLQGRVRATGASWTGTREGGRGAGRESPRAFVVFVWRDLVSLRGRRGQAKKLEKEEFEGGGGGGKGGGRG